MDNGNKKEVQTNVEKWKRAKNSKQALVFLNTIYTHILMSVMEKENSSVKLGNLETHFLLKVKETNTW